MNHSRAKAIFEEIQSKPYNVSVDPMEKVNNCYYKGMELIQKLGTLGYPVRGRVGETYWDTNIIPKEIVDLFPSDVPVLHFYVEVMIDGNWCILDPSFQPELERLGFTIGSWDFGKPCFDMIKVYSHEEALELQDHLDKEDVQRDYYVRSKDGLEALSKWFSAQA